MQFEGEGVTGGRVVLSGAAPVPWRARAVEEAIIGRPLDAETIASGAEAAVKGARPLEHNGYKVDLFRGLLEEELGRIGGLG